MPQTYYPSVPFPLDHIVAKQHRGPTTANNLALSCLHCNAHKGPNLSGIDPVSHKLTQLFNPRRHKWGRHFRWDGPYILGKTAIGRTTIEVLAMNHADLIEVRQGLMEEGFFFSS
jgi:hypothetical protein